MKKVVLFLFLLLFPTTLYALELPVDVTATGVFLYDIEKDKALYEKNPDQEVVLASLTKIMTAYTVLEHVPNIKEKVRIDESDLYNLYGFTQIGLEVDDVVTIEDLLYAMLLYSAADASQALAHVVAGNDADFVALMNIEAQKLHMRNSYFADSFGRDDHNVSTPREMAYLLNEALKNETFKKIFTTTQYRMSNGVEVVNYTRSWLTYYGLDDTIFTGNKPGYTEVANLLLASTATIQNTDYILILCNASLNEKLTTHILESYQILDYVRTNYYAERTFIKKGTILKKIKVEESTINEYVVTAERDVKAVLSDEDYQNVTLDYHIVDAIDSSYKKGDNLGYIDIYSGNDIVATYHVYLTDSIFQMEEQKRISILVMVVLLIVILLLCLSNVLSNKKKKY